MIHFENVSKYYPTKQGRSYVFKDINVSLPTDKNIAVLGPNGVGKSTLIKMLGGADYPSRGKIKSEQRISWPLGLQGGLQGSMSARENVRFVARIHGHKDTKPIEKQVADFAEIGKYFDEPVRTYSNGMRSKITFGLAMAFELNFDVLLIDELTAVGDASFKAKSKKLLLEKYENTKLIMVNHSMGELKQFCEAGIVIKNQGLQYYPDLAVAIEDYQETYVNAKR
jgi:capsular polysaccharide transport system ATP-binding protein